MKKNNIKHFLLVVVSLALNLIGSNLATAFGWPLYLDNVGTFTAAILGGYMPGIIVGFLTNLINGVQDYTTTYYSVISVLLACAAAFFTDKGYFDRKKPWKVLLPVITFVIIGGGVGSVLTWEIYGSSIGEEVSASLATKLYENYIGVPYLAELVADLLIDLPDKIITLAISLLLILITPKSWLPKKRHLDLSNRNSERLSLGTKLIILVSLAVVSVAGTVAFVSYRQFRDYTITDKSQYALSVAQFASSQIDPDMVDTYIEQGEAAPGYLETEQKLQFIYRGADSLEYLYVYKIEEDGCHVVFDMDTPELEGGEPGDIIEFDESFSEYIPDLLAGNPIEPIVTNDTYGWLLTAYVPVYDSEGNCVCYAAVDISMPDLESSERIFATKIIAMLLGFFTLILALGVTLADIFIIEPVNSIAAATTKFNYNSDDARSETVERLKGLVINTGDEIEHLYHALTKTTQDTVDYISESQRKSEALEMLQSAMINVMANLVESRDESTGTHIKNTAEYVQIIVDELKKEGTPYADQMTDEYMADVVASAPLHDIGKIMVPDAILNKPGKLTDAEYEVMKTHAEEGGKIIEDVIRKVGNIKSGYLNEAKNMAHYHHEKWNGKGYPEGLSGEDIPLSARIMAVADVFDALVAERCYKPPFSFEDAMSIIKKDAGTHFDPVVAQVFINAEERVRKVTEETH